MRVALVSPYSWTYPGGVTRHIEALAAELDRAGPRRARARAVRSRPAPHRAAAPRRAAAGARAARTGWCRSAARSAGRPTAPSPTSRARRTAVSTLRRELRAGGFDVVHLHEPVAPVVGWDALTSADAPLVGTFHCYSESRAAAQGRRAARRAAQAQPPQRADRGVRGRRLDRAGASTAAATGSSPTASSLPDGGVPAPRRARAGRAAADRVRRPGRRAQGPAGAAARLRGAARPGARRADDHRRSTADELAPLLVDGDGVTALGRVDDDAKARRAARRRRARARRRSAASRSGWC